jgi:hypothetical protein
MLADGVADAHRPQTDPATVSFARGSFDAS